MKLQIARDMRGDATVRLPEILATIPAEVKALCEQYKKEQEETGNVPEIPDDVVTKLSTQLKDEVLDLNVEELLVSLQDFQKIVQKTRLARKRLANLLIRSRCRFGSEEAAEAFYGLDETITNLQKRKEVLSDAMDLEGITVEEDTSKDEPIAGLERDLEPFSWYDKGPDAKRPKVQ